MHGLIDVNHNETTRNATTRSTTTRNATLEAYGHLRP
jgi:hypothetical protein